MSDVTDRLDKLEAALAANQIPTTMAILQRKLEQSWQPDAGVLLQPGSVGPDALNIPFVANYVPTWTGSTGNPVIGNGFLGGMYIKIGSLVAYSMSVIAGSTTTFGSGTYGLSLPLPARSGQRWVFVGDLLNAGTQHYPVTAVINGGATFEEILPDVDTAAGSTTWSPTVPFTFGDGDRITLSGVYAT